MWQRLPKQIPLVLGHRGARLRAPENTLAAFDLAMDEGAGGVELDVRLDRTGEVVVLHDRTLTRVTGGADQRDVEQHAWSSLSEVNVGQGERIPRLASIVAWARARKARVNVELKGDVTHRRQLVDRTVALLARESPDRFLLSSFHPGMVLRALALTQAWMTAPLPVTLLVHPGLPWADGRPTWQQLRAAGVHPATELVTPKRFALWKRHGALVNVWTVNDPHRASDLAHLGVDALITDDPRSIVRAVC